MNISTITVAVTDALIEALDTAAAALESDSSERHQRTAQFRADTLGHVVELDLLRAALLAATIRRAQMVQS